MSSEVLTNFFLGGVPKAGTTVIWHYLSQHPDIYMGAEKEIYFFTHRWDRGLDWYRSLYADYSGQRMVGDGSINILGSRDAPRRIRQFIRNPKFVFVLRNPVDRLWSDYNWGCQLGYYAHLTFEQYLRQPDSQWTIRLGRYIDGIRIYATEFGRDAVWPILYCDFNAAPVSTMQGVFEFLGVNSNFEITPVVRNVGAYQPPGTALRWLYRAKQFLGLKRMRVLNRAQQSLLTMVRRFGALPDARMSNCTRLMLLSYYRDANQQLEEYLGRTLESWAP